MPFSLDYLYFSLWPSWLLNHSQNLSCIISDNIMISLLDLLQKKLCKFCSWLSWELLLKHSSIYCFLWESDLRIWHKKNPCLLRKYDSAPQLKVNYATNCVSFFDCVSKNPRAMIKVQRWQLLSCTTKCFQGHGPIFVTILLILFFLP